MSNRISLIAGNWKMNTELATARALADGIVERLREAPPKHAEVVLCAPFPFLGLVGERIEGTKLHLGAQTVSEEPSGAFTGEVSVAMLKSVGCEYVIVGHSERRTMFAESDRDVREKANAALDGGLKPIICIGETKIEREDGRAEAVIERQLRTALDGIYEFSARSCVIAYEPVWAIGAGTPATGAQIAEAHAHIRSILQSLYPEAAEEIRVIYGGSVNAANAREILALDNVDGALVGGASIDAEAFVTIVQSV